MTEDERFVEWYTRMFDEILSEYPIAATGSGKHNHDHLLGDISKEHAIKMHEKIIAYWADMKEKFDRSKLSFENQVDYDLLEHKWALEKFRFEELQLWKSGYRGISIGGYIVAGPAGMIGVAMFPLMTGEFAPFEIRAESLVSRMEKVPEFLERSKDTWFSPVELWTRMAINECETTAELMVFVNNLIKYHPATERKLSERAIKASKAATESIESYKKYLELEVIPRANHDWSIGKEKFTKLLELMKLPYDTDQLLEMGWKFFNETKADLEKLATDIAPGKTLEEVRNMVKHDQPTSFEEVLALYRKSVEGAREFIAERGLATVPVQGESIEVKETPASLVPLVPIVAYFPPAYFDEVKKGQLVITRPKDESKLESRNGIVNLSLHEAYPGHHLQRSVTALNNSFIRIYSSSSETGEGWALYCEQMMIEEGYEESKEYEFSQKLGTLWRVARIIIDIGLSTGNMSIDEAIEFMVDNVGREKEGETGMIKIYTLLPTLPLSYTLGKNLVLQLREKMMKKLGNKFSLRFFHDIILRNGSIPYHFLEQVMERETNKIISKSRNSFY